MSLTRSQKLKLTQDQIKNHIINALAPEQLVAISLFKKGLTEDDLWGMRERITNIDYPTFVKIANYLRDKWRETNEQI